MLGKMLNIFGHVCKFEDVEVSRWFGRSLVARRGGGTIWLHGYIEQCSPCENTRIYFSPNFDDFLDKSKYTSIFAGFSELTSLEC